MESQSVYSVALKSVGMICSTLALLLCTACGSGFSGVGESGSSAMPSGSVAQNRAAYQEIVSRVHQPDIENLANHAGISPAFSKLGVTSSSPTSSSSSGSSTSSSSSPSSSPSSSGSSTDPSQLLSSLLQQIQDNASSIQSAIPSADLAQITQLLQSLQDQISSLDTSGLSSDEQQDLSSLSDILTALQQAINP